MGDQDDRDLVLAVQPLQKVDQLLRRLGVDRARRLVQEDQGRPVDHRAGDRNPLHLAARELGRTVLDAVAQADALDQLDRPPLARLSVLDVALRQHHVLEHVQTRQQVVLLEHEADLPRPRVGPLAVAEPGRLDVVDDQAARCRLQQQAEEVEHRGLAAARAPHDRNELAPVDLHRHPIEGADDLRAALVVLGQVDELDAGHQSFLNAITGSSRAARHAGSTPATAPSTVAKPMAKIVSAGVIRNSEEPSAGANNVLRETTMSTPKP